MNQHGDVLLVNSLHQTIVDWIQLNNLQVNDVLAISKILSALTHRLGADGTIKAIPLIFKMQELVKTSVIKTTARQRAVAAIVVEWLIMVGEFYRIDSLVQYAESIKNERIRLGEYAPLFLDMETTVNTFEELEPNNTTPVDKFIDKKMVVDMLSQDGPLRDEEDTEGAELESKLNVEWGTKADGQYSLHRFFLYFILKQLLFT